MHRGKVRDIYEAGEHLLFIATDRISAFDCVIPNGIPDKGRVLTQMSLFWFDYLKDVVPNHLLTAKVDEYPVELRQFRDQLEGRSMLVKKAEMFPVECVARGYVSGVGMEGLLPQRSHLRNSVACRTFRERPVAGADFYACDEGPDGPR